MDRNHHTRAPIPAAVHWIARLRCFVEAMKAHKTVAYEPVPLKVAGSVRVKYLVGGRLRPLPYPAD